MKTNLPDFTNQASVWSALQALSNQTAELRDLLDQVQSDAQDVKQTLNELKGRPQPALPSANSRLGLIFQFAAAFIPTRAVEMKEC
jgi:hypothetical protein